MTDPTLPEAVEQAIHAADETNTRIAEAANGSDLTDLYTEWGEALTALRSAILSYGAARERQGIERAARVVCRQCGEGSPVEWVPESSVHEPYRTAGWHHAVENAYKGQLWCNASAIRALPVDGATP